MSARRILAVFWLDFTFQLKRPLFWFLIIITALLALGLASGNARVATGDSSVGGKKAFLTSEFAVTISLTVEVFLIYMFFTAVAAGMSLIRDEELKVGDLLHSSPLRPAEYVFAKFAAALGMIFVALAANVLLSMLFNQGLPRDDANEVRGPFMLSAYARPVLYMIAPFLIFFAGTSFAIGALTKRPILVFILPVAFLLFCGFFLWTWSPTWLDPRINDALCLAEPSGFRWLNETFLRNDRGSDYYNLQPVGYTPAFIATRILFACIGFGAVAFTSLRFARSLRGSKMTQKRAAAAREAAEHTTTAGEPAAADARATVGNITIRAPGFLRGAIEVARIETRALLRQPGMYLFVPLILLQVIENALFAQGPFETELLATPGALATRSVTTLTAFGCLLLLFYTVESLERDRTTGIGSLLRASSAGTASLLFGKALANSFIAIAVLGAGFVACIGYLLYQGTVPIAIWPFALVWGLFVIPTFILWTSFITAVDSLVRNRYASYAVALAALAGTGWVAIQGNMTWAWNWPLWGAMLWSDLSVFEIDRMAILMNRLGVLAAAGFFIYVAVRFSPRTERDSIRTMQRLAPSRLFKSSWRLLLAAAPAVFAGVWLYTEVRAGFQGSLATKKMEDYWRRNLSTWNNAPEPDAVALDLSLDLDPEKRHFKSVGTYEFVNTIWEKPLKQFALTAGEHWTTVKWKLNGESYQPEDRSGLWVFTPAKPLAKGEHINVGFECEGIFPRGITRNGGGNGYFILKSGVVLMNFAPDVTPTIGFIRGAGPAEATHAPQPREFPDDYWEGITEAAFGSNVPLDCRVRISGPAEYTYNSVGTLKSDNVIDGRRTVVWETEHPVMAMNVVAGKWEVRRKDGVALYYDPRHPWNVDEMFETLVAARKYYSEWFRPYPWNELKISEFPGLSGYAQGFPTNITFSESIGFLTKSDAKTQLASMVTAHESAHQWWGNIVQPGEGRNGNLLSEGMAHFSTMMLLEQIHGERGRREFAKRIEERYGRSRRPDAEKPLIQLDGSKDGDTTLWYDKGGWAFWMLQQTMGRDANLKALKAFILQYEKGPDHPVLQDFILSLRPFAPDKDAYDECVNQWFKKVVLPEYQFLNVIKKKSEGADGGWTVTATLQNLGTGQFEVGVASVIGERFAEDAEEGVVTASRKKQDWRESKIKIKIGAGESKEIVIKSDFEPERVVVDPDIQLLQLRRNRALYRF
ncbi:MAG: hypothetical protein HY286_12380 [Planctomycetes bacterium]|nr:hypothetical protein [Planctomycetota bacterium]